MTDSVVVRILKVDESAWGPGAKNDPGETSRQDNSMASRRGPVHSVAGTARSHWSPGKDSRARAQEGVPVGLGSVSARSATSGWQVGGREIIGWRSLLAQVHLDDLYHADAARLRPVTHPPASAEGVWAASRGRSAARRRHKLRHLGKMDKTGRDMHHGHGPIYLVIIQVRRCPTRYHCPSPALGADAGRRVELPAAARCNSIFSPHNYQRARRPATLRTAPWR